MLRAGEIAAAASPKAQVINMLQVPGGSESQQVMLQVRFAEVNRRALTELGLSLFALTESICGAIDDAAVRGPELRRRATANGSTFSDFLNLFFFDWKEGIGGVMRALEQRGAFRASPNRT